MPNVTRLRHYSVRDSFFKVKERGLFHVYHFNATVLNPFDLFYQDLLGVAPNKLVLIDINTGSLLKSWRYSTLIDWNVNWEVKKMQINFNEEDIEFECLSADCKVIHEYIGGYIYMSMRSKDNDKLDEQEFLKLTGGWNELDQSEEGDAIRKDFD